MTTDLKAPPTLKHPAPAARRDEDPAEVTPWNRPINNPHRSALLASASTTLAETARRIEQLQARLEELITQPANS